MTRWRRLAWQAVWIVGLLLWAMPGWAQTVHYPAFLTLSGGATLNGVVYGAGTSSLLSTAQGPANSVLTANAGAPTFSATPQVTALGLGRAAPASGASIVSTGTLDWNGDTILVRDALGVIANKSSLTNTGMLRQYTDATNSNWIGLGPFGGTISTTTGNIQITNPAGGALPFAAAGLWIASATYGVAGNDVIRGNAAGTLDIGTASIGIKRLYCDFTNTATVGAVTINKACGRVNIAAAGTSVVVTDSLVTAASHVACWVSSTDATAQVKSCVPAAGSFTITTAATTGQTSFDFQVFSAD